MSHTTIVSELRAYDVRWCARHRGGGLASRVTPCDASFSRTLRTVRLRAAALLTLTACGSSATVPDRAASYDWGDASTSDDAGLRTTSGAGASGGTRGGGGGASTTPPWNWQAANAVDCPASAELVYVTGPNAELYSFDPPRLTFTKVGPIGCGVSPSHMTVDRHGIAWVVSDGKLYRVSTTTAVCAEVTNWKPDATGFPDFALTFLGTSATDDDSLYVLGQTAELLAAFDPTSGELTSIGKASLTASIGDLTSDGDGKLYLLVDADPRALVQLAPTSAKTVATYEVNAAPVSDQALAYYGGAFYVFEDTLLFKYDPSTKAVTSVGTAPITVTGAGQSPCVH
jgi:hypothetical protein